MSFGYTGVDLFLMLSGFLIGGILLDHRDSPSFVRTFYVKRFARIVPLALLCILTGLVAGGAGLLLAAGLSHRFLETPLVRWGQRHAY